MPEAVVGVLVEVGLVGGLRDGPEDMEEVQVRPVEEPLAAEGEETSVERRLTRVEARLDELERALGERGVLD